MEPDQRIHEKCGIFGVFGKGLDAARLTYFGLFALQHRGQESSGISVSNGKRIKTHKAGGLVTQVYQEKDLRKLKGYIAIGHNRYSTSGGSKAEHIQPILHEPAKFALAHNGNLPDVSKLVRFLKKHGISTKGVSDSALIYKAIHFYLKTETIENSIIQAFPLFTGAFCIVVLTKHKLIAFRDAYGIRPLCLGKLGEGYIVASETCALDTIGATFVRDIHPGEMVVIDEKGIESFQITLANHKLDIFEFIYFCRPDSMLMGKSVYEVRKNLGKELAKEFPMDADFVIPIPESAIPAAIGYSQQSKIPFEFGLVKNRYIGRTFILPDQQLRERAVHMKLNPVDDILRGKKVVVIDDSIVRGTTAKKLVKMIRGAGAKEIHLMSSCPPFRYPDFYGIDAPSQSELIASQMDVSEIEKFVGADSLSYLSYNGMIRATELDENLFSTSCFTGIYPIDIGRKKKTISHLRTKKRIAVLISNIGTGTNLQAIIDGVENKKINAEIAIVLSDTEASPGLERARKHHLTTMICPKKEDLLRILQTYNLDYIALAGWRQIILEEVIEAFPNQILNTHPGLIPDSMDSFVENPDKTKGLWNRKKMTEKAIQLFLDEKATYAGCSNHFLTKEFDFGPVMGRCFEKVMKDDTVTSLYGRLKVKENQLYADVLAKLCRE